MDVDSLDLISVSFDFVTMCFVEERHNIRDSIAIMHTKFLNHRSRFEFLMIQVLNQASTDVAVV